MLVDVEVMSAVSACLHCVVWGDMKVIITGGASSAITRYATGEAQDDTAEKAHQPHYMFINTVRGDRYESEGLTSTRSNLYSTTYGLPIIVTNSLSNCGSYHSPKRLARLTFLDALEEKPLSVYGNDVPIRDRFYVEGGVWVSDKAVSEDDVGKSYGYSTGAVLILNQPGHLARYEHLIV